MRLTFSAKINILLAVVFGVLSVQFIFMRLHQEADNNFLFEMRATTLAEYYGSFLELEGERMRMFTYDYSYWDDPPFSPPAQQGGRRGGGKQTRDTVWARYNLSAPLASSGVDYVWVLDPKFNLLHIAVRTGGGAEPALPYIPFDSLFLASSFPHFYHNTDRGVMEFRGAPIQPTADVARRSPAQGYLIAGRLLNRSFAVRIADQVGADVDIQPEWRRLQPDEQSDLTRGLITYVHPLIGWNGSPVGRIVICNQSSILAKLWTGGGREVREHLLMMLALLLTIGWLARRWFSRPLRLLAESVRSGDLTGIGGLQRDRSDLGKLALSLVQSHRQREELAESRRAQAALIANLPGMAYRCKCDPVCTMEVVSDGCADLTGYAPEEIIGNKVRAYRDLVVLEDRQLVAEKIDAALAAGRQYEITYRITTANGALKWVWERGLGVAGSDGKIEAREGFVTDVSERKHAQRELLRVNRTLKVIRDCNQVLVRSGNELELLHSICHLLVEHGGYRMAWVGYKQDNVEKSVEAVAFAGYDAQYVEQVQATWADVPHGRGPTGTAIRTGEPSVLRSTAEDSQYQPWRDAALQRGYKSSVAMPLRVANEVIGALSIYSGDEDAFDAEELHLLTELAVDVSFGISVARVRLDRERANYALEQNEERFRRMFEEHSAVMLQIDPEALRITDANYAAESFYGYSRERMQGMQLTEIVVAGEAEVRDRMRRTLSREQSEFLVQHRTASGDLRMVHLYSSPIMVQGRNILFSIVVDVSDRLEAERARRTSEERYRLLFRSSPVGLLYYDTNLRVTDCNDRLVEIFGSTRENLIGLPIRTIKDISVLPAIAAGLTGEGGYYEGEYGATTSGFRGSISLHTTPILSPDGTVTGALATVEDITKRVKTLTSLRESESRFRSLVESMDDTILAIDTKGLVSDVYGRWLQRDGLSPDYFLGRSAKELLGEDVGGIHEEANRRALQGEIVVYEWLLDVPGVRRNMQTSLSPIFGEGGEVVGLVSIGRDVTSLKQIEEQLRQAAKLEAIGRLAGGVAHDFNNLLTALMVTAEMMQQSTPADSPLAGDIEQILAIALRGSNLTQQLLAFSRPRAPKAKIINLSDVLEGTDRMLRRLIGENIKLIITTEPQLPTIKADPSQIELAVMNLVINARDAMPKGGTISVEASLKALDESYASLHPEVAPGNYCCLSVGDEGVGMSKDILERATEPFFTTKPVGKGTGLGLSTVHGIVRRSGGHLHIYSEVGVGTTVNIYLPTAGEAVEVVAWKAAAETPHTGSETILVADDDEAVRRVTVRILQSQGYKVIEAADGRLALEAARNYDGVMHLLISDMVMPHMGGIELAQQLTAERPGVKVLLMSGYSPQAYPSEKEPESPHPFIQKPFRALELARRVREILDGLEGEGFTAD